MSFRTPFAAALLGAGLLLSGNARAHSPPDLLAAVALQANTQSRETRYALGAVVDVRRANVKGVTILAITPGGAADRMGLQAGDQLRVVNGARLDNTLTPSSVLENVLQQGNGVLEVEAVRNGRPIFLSGRAGIDEASPPGTPDSSSGCGYVSTLGVVPKVSQGIHSALITSIDGRSTPLQPPNRHRLAAGRHVLIVSEAIDDFHLTSSQAKDRDYVLDRLRARAYKALVVNVKPGTSLRIGAKLLRDKLDRQSIRNNAYWQPVVWKEVPDTCR